MSAAAGPVVAVLQARMSSTRLPGKVLRPLAGGPMILRQIERLRRARRLDRILVATSTLRSDDVLADICEDAGVEVVRGSLDDVLDRFRAAAEAAPEAAHIARLTADCPFSDPEVADACVALHLETGADYSANVIERGYPKGLDVEVFTRAALARACREAADPYEREHVTPYFYRHPELFRLAGLAGDPARAGWRWTVDTPEDYAMAAAVYDALYAADPAFSSADVERFLRANPQVAALNGALG